MLIGFNNIHFSWKETILLIEERRERREGARRGWRVESGASFHFQVRPWDDAFEIALYRFRANEIKWCRPWQKGKPKLKAIYFHWGMWHCSGTINRLSVDTEIWGEGTHEKEKRDKNTKKWLMAQMSGGRAKSRPGQMNCNAFLLLLYLLYFYLFLLSS